MDKKLQIVEKDLKKEKEKFSHANSKAITLEKKNKELKEKLLKTNEDFKKLIN